MQSQNLTMETNKARVVVLGSGWGAMTFLRGLDPSRAKSETSSPASV